jgi:hypothetical protein
MTTLYVVTSRCICATNLFQTGPESRCLEGADGERFHFAHICSTREQAERWIGPTRGYAIREVTLNGTTAATLGEDDFEADLDYLAKKNAELYGRLD